MLERTRDYSISCLLIAVSIVFSDPVFATTAKPSGNQPPLVPDTQSSIFPEMNPSRFIDAHNRQIRLTSIALRTPTTQSAGIPIGTTTLDVQYWSALGRRITYDYNAPPKVHMVWTYLDNFNFFDPGLSIKYQVFNATDGLYEFGLGGEITSDLPYSWIASCAAYPDNRFIFACLRNGWEMSIAAIYTELAPNWGLFSRDDVFPSPDSSWYFEDLVTPFPVVEVQYGTDTVV